MDFPGRVSGGPPLPPETAPAGGSRDRSPKPRPTLPAPPCKPNPNPPRRPTAGRGQRDRVGLGGIGVRAAALLRPHPPRHTTVEGPACRVGPAGQTCEPPASPWVRSGICSASLEEALGVRYPSAGRSYAEAEQGSSAAGLRRVQLCFPIGCTWRSDSGRPVLPMGKQSKGCPRAPMGRRRQGQPAAGPGLSSPTTEGEAAGATVRDPTPLNYSDPGGPGKPRTNSPGPCLSRHEWAPVSRRSSP
jgi:hypothetical protein